MLVIASGVTAATTNIPGFDMKEFWQRSFEMANTAKRLAKLSKLAPQLGYTCGLLSNIGELVLHIALPAEAAQIDKIVSGGTDRITTERMLLGVDLTEIGAELARRWNFPDEIQEAIRNQHSILDDVSQYAHLIGLTSFVVSGFSHGMSEREMYQAIPRLILNSLNIDDQQLEEVMTDLKDASTMVDELF